MRKSLLLGVLAYTLIFAGYSPTAEAITLNQEQDSIQQAEIEESELAFVEIVADVAETESVELAELLVKERTKEIEKSSEVVKHTVTDNETLEKIATKYKVSWQRIFDKNDNIADPNVISKGDVLIIPDDDEKLESRELPKPAVITRPRTQNTAPSNVRSAVTVSRGSSSGNGYVAGYCTWYVKNRRPDLPNNLGNAHSWFTRAASQGMPTGYAPRVGAVAQRNNHVAYVESVNADGTITISDMNYRNLYEKTVRTVSPSEWRFIY